MSLQNNSKQAISLLYTNNVKPDLTENNIAFFLTEQQIIKPDSSWEIVGHGGENFWHDYIQQGPSKKLHIYVFDVDTLKKYDGMGYSMNEVETMHKYLRLMEYSEDELIKKKWKISYN